MTTVSYSLVVQGGSPMLTFVLDGQPHTVSGAHPRFREIRDHLTGTEDHDPDLLRSLLDTEKQVSEELRRLSDRVAYRDGNLYLDGDLVDKPITRQIVRLIRESNGVVPAPGDVALGQANDSSAILPLVRFLENLAQNPSRQSRQHLYSWLAAQDFTITPDGMILCYKGVQDDGLNSSVSRGSEQVEVAQGDHVEVHVGHIPNPVGATVTIPRSLVNPDREHGCSIGLHVGTHSYASTFGRLTLHVLVNPRDVVAVPSCSGFHKMRVARYIVLGVSSARVYSALFAYDGEDDDDDDDTSVFPAYPNSADGAEPEEDGDDLTDTQDGGPFEGMDPEPVEFERARTWWDRLIGR